MAAFRYPLVEVEVKPGLKVGSDDAAPDVIQKVTVDGVDWPVIALSWAMEGPRDLPVVTLKIRGRLRIAKAEE